MAYSEDKENLLDTYNASNAALAPDDMQFDTHHTFLGNNQALKMRDEHIRLDDDYRTMQDRLARLERDHEIVVRSCMREIFKLAPYEDYEKYRDFIRDGNDAFHGGNAIRDAELIPEHPGGQEDLVALYPKKYGIEVGMVKTIQQNERILRLVNFRGSMVSQITYKAYGPLEIYARKWKPHVRLEARQRLISDADECITKYLNASTDEERGLAEAMGSRVLQIGDPYDAIGIDFEVDPNEAMGLARNGCFGTTGDA